MKNLIWIIALVILTTTVNAQKSIDALFDKYAGKEGFTTVTINGNLLKLAASLDDDKKGSSLPKGLTQIRILAQENDSAKVENFYDLIIKDLDLKQYEEFMQVKSSDQKVKMLVRTDGDMFKEFLLIVGGKDNAIIQIKGNMTFNEAKEFADGAKKGHGINLLNNH
jgi:Domain of unknown function (DUF4252)